MAKIRILFLYIMDSVRMCLTLNLNDLATHDGGTKKPPLFGVFSIYTKKLVATIFRQSHVLASVQTWFECCCTYIATCVKPVAGTVMSCLIQ